MALLYRLSYNGKTEMKLRRIRSQIIDSPTLINFRDPGSRFHVLVKHRSAFRILSEAEQSASSTAIKCFPRQLKPSEKNIVGREGFEPPKPEGDRFTVCCD